MRALAVAVLFFAALSGCSGKQFKSDDLKSEIQQAAQLARECALFLNLHAAGKVTQHFRASHGLYLVKQAAQLQQDIRNAQPGSGSRQWVFLHYRQKLEELSRQIGKLESARSKDFLQLSAEFDSMEKEL